VLFAYVYPSAYGAQYRLNVAEVQRIAGVLDTAPLVFKAVSVQGHSRVSPVVANTAKSFPMVRSLAGPLDGGWRTHEIFKHYGLELEFSTDAVSKPDWEVDTQSAELRGSGDLLEIRFRG